MSDITIDETAIAITNPPNELRGLGVAIAEQLGWSLAENDTFYNAIRKLTTGCEVGAL